MPPIARTVLRTERLTLRPFEPGDVDAVFAACQDPEIQRWTRVPTPYTGGDAVQYVTQFNPAGWADGTAAGFAVCESASSELVASVGLHFNRHDDEGIAEIAYWCAASARGRGFVPEAVAAIAHWGFAVCGVERIEWRRGRQRRVAASRREGGVRRRGHVATRAGAQRPAGRRLDRRAAPRLMRLSDAARSAVGA